MEKELEKIREVQALAHRKGLAGEPPDIHRDGCEGSRFAYCNAFAAGRIKYRESIRTELPRDWWRG